MSGSADNTIGVQPAVGADKAEGANALYSSNFEIDSSINEEERRFYIKAYATIDLVNYRKVHCTVCRSHIGTAPNSESTIKMHPILRVTHCIKCHEFYNSGEFSKGEDGSELYCRWCGQGGEVYCCSNCPFVFCKSCIVKNLSRGVVADIEQNENWNCFNCAPKILWPLRAQHWALINYIEAQKKLCKNMNEGEMRAHMAKDNSQCCRLAKSKANSMSDSLESLESNASKRSHASVGSLKKPQKSPLHGPSAKRQKTSNDEVVCTPDLLSMLEPDCQLTVAQKTRPPMSSPAASTPKIVSVHTQQQKSTPPPLVLANTSIKVRQIMPQSPILRRSIIGVRPGSAVSQGATSPVYHTINGFRIDLNSAAQQETFRLPNGKLIQVKRQGTAPPQQPPATTSTAGPLLTRPRNLQPNISRPLPPMIQNNFSQPNQTVQQQPVPSMVRISNVPTTHGNTTITPMPLVNGVAVPGQPVRPQLNRFVFNSTPIGQARSQLQDQIFNAMDICTHLTGKIASLTNSNAYKQARNYLEVKELYIHLSYLFTYAIGRFKGVQDKCLTDMRQLGFTNDADSLENGQLAADKQASDDDEIEIVEPKTDTITIDSDNEEESSTSSASVRRRKTNSVLNNSADNIDVNNITSSILATMLEVDFKEGNPLNFPQTTSPNEGGVQRKQPRKKTTNKPNPALLQLERERLEEIKRTDAKLKKKVVVKLTRAEMKYPIAKQWLENQQSQKLLKKEFDTTANNVNAFHSPKNNKCVVKPKECEITILSIDKPTEKLSSTTTNLNSSYHNPTNKSLEAIEANITEINCEKTIVTNNTSTEKLSLTDSNLVHSFPDESLRRWHATEASVEESRDVNPMERSDKSTEKINAIEHCEVSLLPVHENVKENESANPVETRDSSAEKLSLVELNLVSTLDDQITESLEVVDAIVQKNDCKKIMEASNDATEKLSLVELNLLSPLPDQSITILKADESNVSPSVDVMESVTVNSSINEQNIICTTNLKQNQNDEILDGNTHDKNSDPIDRQTLLKMSNAENELNVQLVEMATKNDISNSTSKIIIGSEDLQLKKTEDIEKEDVIKSKQDVSNADFAINTNCFTNDNIASSTIACANDKDELNLKKNDVQLMDLELEDIVSDDSNLITLTESISATEMTLNELDLGLNTAESSGVSADNAIETTQELGVQLSG